MTVDLTSRDERSRTRWPDYRKHSPNLDSLESRLLLSADFKAFATSETVLSGIDAKVDVAYYASNRTGHVDAATIDWGDGTATTTGTVTPLASASFLGSIGNIEGDHTYAATGSYTVKTTLIEHVVGAADVTSTVSGTLNAVMPTVTATAELTLIGAPGQAITDGVVATLQTNITGADKAFKATIDWGDGSTPSTGIISSKFGLDHGRDHGADDAMPSAISTLTSDYLAHFGDGSRPYAVTGSHTYATAGSYTATVTLDDGAGHTATASTSVTIATSTLVAASPDSLNAVTGIAISGPLAKVVDIASGASLDTSSLTATIDWGDGSATSPGEVHGGGHFFHTSDGQPTYVISGNHTYAQAGDEKVTITVTDKNGRIATTTTTVHVQSETITATSATISATTGLDGDYQVATGTDAPIVRGNHLSATIDWGDGSTPTTGRVLSIGGFPFLTGSQSSNSTSNPFIVVGNHPYATAGSYKVHVTITSDGGVTSSTDSTATVTSFSAFGIPKFAHAGTALINEPVAAIAMLGGSAVASDFTATIDWGDGSATNTGAIVSKNLPHGPWFDTDVSTKSALLVSGTHTYAAAGTYTAKVTIADTKTGESTIVSSNVVIAAATTSAGGDSGSGSIGIIVTPLPTTGSPIGVVKVVATSPPTSTTTVPTTTTPAASHTTNVFHTKKGAVKITHHEKAVVKARAHHSRGPLG